MKTKLLRQPPDGAPEGTVWFGGPVDRFRITLRILGDQLDPDQVSDVLGMPPTSSARKGDPFPRKGRWLLEIESKDCGQDVDVEDGIELLFSRLPSDPDFWASLTTAYNVDIFCGLFLTSANRGFGISAEVSKLLADRHLEIGFDLYFDPDAVGFLPKCGP